MSKFKVGQRVSLMGDLGVVIVTRIDDSALVEFDDGTFGEYYDGELEAAE